MPVVTRAAAVRSQFTGDDKNLKDPTTSIASSTNKTIKRDRGRPKKKTQEGTSHLNTDSSKSETTSMSHPQSTISTCEASLEATAHLDEEPVTLLTSPAPTVATGNTSLLNNNEISLSEDEVDTFMNELVVEREITTGISNRKCDMVFMNGYSYLHMNIVKETIGWLCAKCSENCKAVIHSSRITEYSLHKLRRKAVPPMLHDQKFIMPSVYLETYSKEPFIIYDKRKSQHGGRLIIFSSPEQPRSNNPILGSGQIRSDAASDLLTWELNVLSHSDILFADGTFRVSPLLFEQL
ncbi:unnamed protein product [Adineta ricciae]|uniref:Uncharacterized protein n=1 Tax=Adineta ricciae TaxID=249248 RepID=A0A815VLQ4_ADIRI|nr:unnamed protein product [Adineta ricciae]CAF1533902.1 unnamed protein product [Adineta ricciae]